MTQITWDSPGSLLYEAGVDRGVFYPASGPGVAWNGLVSIKETTDDILANIAYVDGQKVLNTLSSGSFAATLSAVTYPDAMLPYDGVVQSIYAQQRRAIFNLSYRSLIGDDVNGLARGYKLHLVYNCQLAPTTRMRQSLDTGTDISEFEWNLSTTPVAVPYERATSHFIINSTLVVPAALAALENILYGQSGLDPAMPTVAQLLAIFDANAIFMVVDNGDGSATITGPAGWVDQSQTDSTMWTLTSPSVIPEDAVTDLVRSY